MIVKILANYAVDITKKSIYLPVLKTASENGYLDILQYLLDVGNVDINEVFSYGFTALMIAVKKDLLPVVQFLIEHGANIYYKDNNNNTALLLGVRYNRSQIINYLVE
ncbi:ankyrin, partial [Piromyces finnis]